MVHAGNFVDRLEGPSPLVAAASRNVA